LFFSIISIPLFINIICIWEIFNILIKISQWIYIFLNLLDYGGGEKYFTKGDSQGLGITEKFTKQDKKTKGGERPKVKTWEKIRKIIV
jgi:hypothetical protein